MRLIDLSQPITDKDSCHFGVVDRKPRLSFEEADICGLSFITSRLDNLYSNICTHITFPGYVYGVEEDGYKSVGRYPLSKFVGKVAVLDFSKKLDPIRQYFDETGKLTVSSRRTSSETLPAVLDSALKSLDKLSIGTRELLFAVKQAKTKLSSLKGIFIYSGLSRLWRYEKFESWEYIYFYGPYLAPGACDLLSEERLSFIGTDCANIDHPITNLTGQELLLVLEGNEQCRDYVRKKLKKIEREEGTQRSLLQNGILIYKNLQIPESCVNRTFEFAGVPLNFQFPGMNDTALVRPYFITRTKADDHGTGTGHD